MVNLRTHLLLDAVLNDTLGIGLYEVGFSMLIVIHAALLLFTIVDVMKSDYTIGRKALWVAVSLFIPFGAIIYFIVGVDHKEDDALSYWEDYQEPIPS